MRQVKQTISEPVMIYIFHACEPRNLCRLSAQLTSCTLSLKSTSASCTGHQAAGGVSTASMTSRMAVARSLVQS